MKKNVSLGGEAVRLTISKVLTLSISMLNSMLLARIRSYEEFGTYSQLLIVINLATSLFMLGLPNSINFFLARADTEEEKRRFLSTYYTVSTLLSGIIGLVLVASVPIIEQFFHNQLVRYFFYFLALYPWASIISSSIGNVLIVYKRTDFLIFYNIIHSVSMMLPVVVVQLLGRGFQTYMIAYTAINVIFAVMVYFLVNYLGGGIGLLLDAHLIKRIFIFSVPMGLSSIVGTLNTEIDKLLIGFLMNTKQLAIYTNAARELPLNIIASSITAVLLPQMARLLKHKKTNEALRLWGCATELATIIIALVVSGVFTYAEEVMSILYSEKYLPGVSVFRVYTLNLLMRVTYFGIVLNASGESRKILLCSILSLILNIVLNPIFYFLFGMIGPAIATMLAILIIQLLQLKMTSKTVDMRFQDVFPWKNYIRIILVNGIFSIFFFLIKRAVHLDKIAGNIGESLLLGGIWTIMYIMLMTRKIANLWKELGRERNMSEA